MKKQSVMLLCGLIAVATANSAVAQNGEDTVVRVVPPKLTPDDTWPSGAPDNQPDNPIVAEQESAGAPGAPAAEKQAAVTVDENPIEEEDGGVLIKDASINDIFQFLAKRAGKQYFHNNKLNTDDYKVTGHLNGNADPLKQMKELGFQYGLRLYVKGNTVYAMMDEQLQQLPAREWTYSLRYLRPTDIEQIKALIQPMLTVGRGIVNYEPKTNTIIVIDTMTHIEMIEGLLRKIDRPKGQIVVEVKILRVNNSLNKHQGIDWSSALGAEGIGIDLAGSLNSLFGLPESSSYFGSSNVVLSPVQLSGVLRALNDGNLVTQKSNPVVITEDNETASVALIDRVPIITSTTTYSGNTVRVTDEVRYKIDSEDSTEPDKTREIGVTMTMTPSLLPDGTIRMKMRPRNAQIIENIKGLSGNLYPRVSEATIETIARIPNGHSLMIGGFYGEVQGKNKKKVPLLGDVPVINFFFKSKQMKKEQSSLVFVVTPTSYDPACVAANRRSSARLRKATSLRPRNNWVDESNPGPAHEPNLRRTIRGMRPKQAPYYPQR